MKTICGFSWTPRAEVQLQFRLWSSCSQHRIVADSQFVLCGFLVGFEELKSKLEPCFTGKVFLNVQFNNKIIMNPMITGLLGGFSQLHQAGLCFIRWKEKVGLVTDQLSVCDWDETSFNHITAPQRFHWQTEEPEFPRLPSRPWQPWLLQQQQPAQNKLLHPSVGPPVPFVQISPLNKFILVSAPFRSKGPKNIFYSLQILF